MVIIAENGQNLQRNVTIINEELKQINIKINTVKSKTIMIGSIGI